MDHSSSNPSQTINQPNQYILIADDDAIFTSMLKEILSDYGYEVNVVLSGEDCLNECKKRIPDLILLDILMPGKDGFQVCKILRNDPLTREIPIVLQSGLSEPEHKIRGYSMGIFDYLTKPYSFDELKVRIENVFRRSKGAQQDLEATKADTVRQLAVTLADRINNPLAGIMGCCQILSRNIGDPEKVIEILEMIKGSVDKIYELILQLSSTERILTKEYSDGIQMIEVNPSDIEDNPMEPTESE